MQDIKIEIVLKDGTLSVTGVLDNKLLCYGLLEAAKDVVRNHRSERRVEPASALPPLHRV